MSTASAPTAVLPATLPLERLDGQPDDLARHLGRVLARAEPRQAPDELLPAIEQALAAPAS